MNEIAYFAPLEKAFGRVKKILFVPFRFTKWLVLGFTAWLATLCEGGGPSGNFNLPSGDGGGGGPNFSALFEKIGQLEIVIIVVAAIVLFIIALVIGLIVTWINSRGKFMFLDNVAHDKAEVKKPWRDFRKQGNSLFLWRIAFGLIVGLVILVLAAVVGLAVYPAVRNPDYLALAIAVGIVGGLAFFMVILFAAYVKMVLVDFVVPVMYRQDMKTMEAWRFFMPALREHFWKTIVYALMKMLLGIAIVIVIVIVVIITCCIAGCLLIIPYVNAVLLLPISVLVRSFSLEFLRQFGDDFNVFPPEPPQAQAVWQPPAYGPTPYGPGPYGGAGGPGQPITPPAVPGQPPQGPGQPW
jgi:MFS family permease